MIWMIRVAVESLSSSSTKDIFEHVPTMRASEGASSNALRPTVLPDQVRCWQEFCTKRHLMCTTSAGLCKQTTVEIDGRNCLGRIENAECDLIRGRSCCQGGAPGSMQLSYHPCHSRDGACGQGAKHDRLCCPDQGTRSRNMTNIMVTCCTCLGCQF